MKQYIVDAFTNIPFAGNPAAVCVMDQWPSDAFMKKMAMENNLSETAFIVKEPEGYRLRWFTPGTEVDLCGHATLASSFVMMDHILPGSNEISFNTRSGKLTVRRKGTRFEMNFPLWDYQEVPVTKEMEEAFGIRPMKAVFGGEDLLCIFEDENQVRRMVPNQTLLMKLPGRLQDVTARGTTVDCVSRSFGPGVAVSEDPVCGSAHCLIANYWARELGKNTLEAYQASARGGYLHCEIAGDRLLLSGEAVLVAVSEVFVLF